MVMSDFEHFTAAISTQHIAWLKAEANRRSKGNGKRFTRSELLRAILDHAMQVSSEAKSIDVDMATSIEAIDKQADAKWAEQMKRKEVATTEEQTSFADETERRFKEALGL